MGKLFRYRILYWLPNQSKLYSNINVFDTDDRDEYENAIKIAHENGYVIEGTYDYGMDWKVEFFDGITGETDEFTDLLEADKRYMEVVRDYVNTKKIKEGSYVSCYDIKCPNDPFHIVDWRQAKDIRQYFTLEVTSNHYMTLFEQIKFALGLDSIDCTSVHDQEILESHYGNRGYEYIYESDKYDKDGHVLYAIDTDEVQRIFDVANDCLAPDPLD